MLEILAGIAVVSFVSAFIPLVNIEAALAVAARDADANLVLLAVAASIGMIAGKLLFYLGARESLRIPWLARKMETPRWQQSMTTWRDRTERHRSWTFVLLLASSFFGLPPYAVMVVVARHLRVRLYIILITGFIGRFAPFYHILLAAQAAWLSR